MRRVAIRALGLGALGALALALPGRWGQCAVFPFLGLLPGLALTRAGFRDRSPAVRGALAIALSPLLVTVPGWIGLAAGLGPALTARALCAVAALAWVLTPDRADRPAGDDVAGADRGVVLAGLALAVAISIPRLANPFIAVRGDSWTHAAIVYQILGRGVPPEDPYFAGLSLAYVWFYNLFLALLSAVRDQEPFTFMTLFNAATAFAMVVIAGATASRVWRAREAGRGAAVLLVTGFNAGAWLLWPLGLARAFLGHVRGWGEVRRILATVRPDTAEIIYQLGAPYAEMVNFLDKLLVGTALNYGYLLMMVTLWGWLDTLERRPARGLALVAAGAAGMMLFHSVVGLSVIPVAVATLLAAAPAARHWPWLGAPGRSVAAAVAAGSGAALALPYVAFISSRWRAAGAASGVHFPVLSPSMAWTVATSCGLVLLLAWRPLRAAWRDRLAAPVVLGGLALAMTGFAVTVDLTDQNEAKFAFEVFYPLMLIAAAAAPGAWRWARARGAWVAAGVVAFLLVTPAATLFGFMADAGQRSAPQARVAPAERAVYDWLRERTPPDAVIVDSDPWCRAVVLARRQLLIGGEVSTNFAFPPRESARRRAVLAAIDSGAAPPLEPLRGLRRPTFVVYRPDRAAPPDSTSGFSRVYDASGFRVYRLEAAR